MKSILKKAFCFIMAVVSVFSITSCGDVQNTTTNTGNIVGNVTGSIADYPPGYSEYVCKEIEYMTFEEMCADVDCIVIANYVDAVPYDDNYAKFTINIKESLYGELSGQIDFYPRSKAKESFKVSVDGREIKFRDDRYAYGKTVDIVFFLVKEDLEGFDEPQYTWHGAPTIDLSYWYNGKMYGEMYNEPIGNHMTGLDMNNTTRENIIAYIESLVAQRNEN